MVCIAISGFGRIGRNFLRAVLHDSSIKNTLQVIAINIGPARIDMVPYLFKYDTLMGTYPGSVYLDSDNTLVIDDTYRITLLSHADPALCPWKKLAIDWVVECSGKFTDRNGAMKHCTAGAKKVLISAPARDEDSAIIPGVNEEKFNAQKDTIVSLGSCTTNAFIPLVKLLHDAFDLQRGFMTTVHAYTNTQVLLDVQTDEPRRSRAAALNIIPTQTGAMSMLGKIMPGFDAKIQAVALRVPVAKVSLIDFTFETKKTLSVDTIHAAVKNVARGRMKGIVDITMDPLVSSDFSGTNFSVIIDGQLTASQGTLGKIFGWYDNEWAYSVRLKDFLVYTSK